MQSELTRILVADDHPIVTRAVTALLEHESDMCVTGLVSAVPEIFSALRRGDVDLLIMDYSMPNSDLTDGLVMLNQIRRQFPRLRIVIYTATENPAILLAIWQTGVEGLVLKTQPEELLVSACRRVVAGGRFPDNEIRAENQAFAATARALSPREAEVLRLFVGGMSMSDIAVSLGRSIKTISNQKWSAMRKLNCESDQALFELHAAGGLRLK